MMPRSRLSPPLRKLPNVKSNYLENIQATVESRKIVNTESLRRSHSFSN